MILIRRLVVPMILKVKLMVVQKNWPNKMEMKRMKNSKKIIMR